MKKIKEILIHWLGGLTETEVFKESKIAFGRGYEVGKDEGSRMAQAVAEFGAYKNGKKAAFDILMKKADELYGLPADDWCKEMYSFILDIRKKL